MGTSKVLTTRDSYLNAKAQKYAKETGQKVDMSEYKKGGKVKKKKGGAAKKKYHHGGRVMAGQKKPKKC